MSKIINMYDRLVQSNVPDEELIMQLNMYYNKGWILKKYKLLEKGEKWNYKDLQKYFIEKGYKVVNNENYNFIFIKDELPYIPLTKGIYRNIVEEYTILPFGVPIKINGIIEYDNQLFCYIKELDLLLPEKDLNGILVSEKSFEKPSIVDDVISMFENTEYSYTFKIIEIDNKKLVEAIKSQQKKGLKKYGQSIDDCPYDKYDWEQMAYEELADYCIYMEKLTSNE